MAKYMDQSGAQHFAEALMSATKTINGQTIWGDGDIPTGSGGIIELTHAELVSKIQNSQLIPGQLYAITDYRPTAVPSEYIYYADASWNASSTDPCILIGRAVNDKYLDENWWMVNRETKMIEYYIKYMPILNSPTTIDNYPGPTFHYLTPDTPNKGVIYWMKSCADTLNIETEFDFRPLYGLSCINGQPAIVGSVNVCITTRNTANWMILKFFPRIYISNSQNISICQEITEETYDTESYTSIIGCSDINISGLIQTSKLSQAVYIVAGCSNLLQIGSLMSCVIGSNNDIQNLSGSGACNISIASIGDNNVITFKLDQTITCTNLTIGDNNVISVQAKMTNVNIGDSNNIAFGVESSDIVIGNKNKRIHIGSPSISSTGCSCKNIVMGDSNSDVCMHYVNGLSVGNRNTYIHLIAGKFDAEGNAEPQLVLNNTIGSGCTSIGLLQEDYDISKMHHLLISTSDFEDGCDSIYGEVLQPDVLNKGVMFMHACFLKKCKKIYFVSNSTSLVSIINCHFLKITTTLSSINSSIAVSVSGTVSSTVLDVWNEATLRWLKKEFINL